MTTIDAHSEEWRHACEVDYIARLPTRERRAAYLDYCDRKRGELVTTELRRAVKERFLAIRQGAGAPTPQVVGQAGADGAVHTEVNGVCTIMVPEDGSSWTTPNASSSDPVRCVDRGVGSW